MFSLTISKISSVLNSSFFSVGVFSSNKIFSAVSTSITGSGIIASFLGKIKVSELNICISASLGPLIIFAFNFITFS